MPGALSSTRRRLIRSEPIPDAARERRADRDSRGCREDSGYLRRLRPDGGREIAMAPRCAGGDDEQRPCRAARLFGQRSIVATSGR